MRYLNFKKIFADYLDIVGILDGTFAYKGPNVVQIDLTNNCNNDCIGCWCNSPLLGEKKILPETKRQTIPFGKIIGLLDELCSMGTTSIYYAGGGEPFMHPQIMDILAYTKKKGFTCYVNTNFTLVDEKIVKKLTHLKIDHLTVSVWAGSAGIYALVHPNKNEKTFNKIKEMLVFLNREKKKYPIVKLYNVIFNLNYHDIEHMMELRDLTNSESIEFTVIDTIPGKTDTLLLSEKDRYDLLQRCKKLKLAYGFGMNREKTNILNFEQFIRRVENADAKSAHYDSDIIDKLPCYVGWAFVRVLADGSVNSCLKSHRFPVGNIHKDKFSKIWNSALQQYFREKTSKVKKTGNLFSLIGNDPDVTMGCYKSCDNIGHTMEMHKKIVKLGRFKKHILGEVAHFLKTVRAT
ncbi:MAG: radical SAM protein [Candidatus Omnitrophica bacterium]|nr:radical SAM protein [Candidatus Omnitrophota bacterium]